MCGVPAGKVSKFKLHNRQKCVSTVQSTTWLSSLVSQGPWVWLLCRVPLSTRSGELRCQHQAAKFWIWDLYLFCGRIYFSSLCHTEEIHLVLWAQDKKHYCSQVDDFIWAFGCFATFEFYNTCYIYLTFTVYFQIETTNTIWQVLLKYGVLLISTSSS